MNKKNIAFAIIILSISCHLQGHDIPDNLKSKIFKNPIHAHTWAIYSQNKFPQKSFEILTKLTKKNKYAYKWLINFLYKTGNLCKITQLIPLIKKRFPDLITHDPDTGFKIANALVKQAVLKTKKLPTQIYNQAMDILVPLNKKFYKNEKIARLTAMLYELNNELRNAIAVSKKYLNSAATHPINFIEYFKNALRYVKLSKAQMEKNKYNKILNKALDSLKKSIELHPQFPNSWVLSAAIKEKLSMIDSAIHDCKEALAITGPNKQMLQVLLTLFFKKKNMHTKPGFFKIESNCFMKALTLFKEGKYNEVLEELNKCLTKKPRPSEDNQKKFLKIKVI